MSPEGGAPSGDWVTFRTIFIVAVILAIAQSAIGVLLSLYLRPVAVSWLSGFIPVAAGQNAFLGNFTAESFYFNVVQNLILFAITPIIFLFVFYKLGTRLAANPVIRYVGLLKYSFLGGIVGYVAGYFTIVGIIWAATGNYTTGDPWFVYLPETAISTVREAVIMTLFAFTGVSVGYLRSKRGIGEGNTATQAVLNDSPQPQVDTALGLVTTKPPPINFSAL